MTMYSFLIAEHDINHYFFVLIASNNLKSGLFYFFKKCCAVRGREQFIKGI